MELFFFAQGGIFERAVAGGQRAAVSAVQLALLMQNLEVLADGDLRGFELLGKFRYQHPALAGQNFENGSAAFFIQHDD